MGSFATLALTLVTLGAIACKPSSSKQSGVVKKSGRQVPTLISLGLSEIPKRPPIKGTQLPMGGFQYDLDSLGSARYLALRAQTRHNHQDFFRYRLCNEQQVCVDGTFAMEQRIPLTLSGRLKLEVRACVEDYRVIDQPCGNPQAEFLLEKTGTSSKERSLLSERFQLIRKLKRIAVSVAELVESFLASTAGSTDPSIQELRLMATNWHNFGPVRNGELYSSEPFRQLILEPETIDELTQAEQQTGLGLTEDGADNTEGNWAYPDGQVPEGKTEDKWDKKDSVLSKTGVALLFAGSIIAVVGFVGVMPNQFGNSIFKETHKSHRRLIAMYIAQGNREGIEKALAINKQLKSIHDNAVAQVKKEYGDNPPKAVMEKVIQATEPYPEWQIHAAYDSREQFIARYFNPSSPTPATVEFQQFASQNQEAMQKLLKQMENSAEGDGIRRRQFIEQIGDRIEDKKGVAKYLGNQKLDTMIVDEVTANNKLKKKMEQVLEKTKHSMKKRAEWEHGAGDVQEFWGKIGLTSGAALAVVGIILIGYTHDKDLHLNGAGDFSVQNFHHQLIAIESDIRSILLQIDEIDRQLAGI